MSKSDYTLDTFISLSLAKMLYFQYLGKIVIDDVYILNIFTF